MSYKWRIRCTVHGWQYDWADTAITECPVESSDPLVAGMVYRVGEEVPVLEIAPRINTTNNSNYTRMAVFTYDSDALGDICRIKVLSYMDSGTTSYDVELYDKGASSSIISANFTNTGDVDECDVGFISSPPTGKLQLEVNMRKTGGGSSKYCHIEHITVYSRRERS